VPEYPDITVYIEALKERILGEKLQSVRVGSPFLLRTVDPPLQEAQDRIVSSFRRVGKRIAIGMDNDVWLVLHLMIAGRVHWKKPGIKLSGKQNLAAFDFPKGSLTLTEAGSQRRASLHMARGEAGLHALDPGGVDVLDSTVEEFSARLRLRNHTLKRALTDPTLFSGIGNAYSDEILYRARLSPIAMTQKLTSVEIHRLFHAIGSTLLEWVERLRAQARGGFPEGVTAFREEMAVHGKYGKPCRECGSPIQRIRYASNETNYCARCQTGGKVLADRALSRLLGADWPRSLEELEMRADAARVVR